MGFKLRQESVALASNLENLEEDKKAAANAGPASLEKFEENDLTKAIVEKDDGASSTPADTSSDDTSNDDSGDDTSEDDGSDDSEDSGEDGKDDSEDSESDDPLDGMPEEVDIDALEKEEEDDSDDEKEAEVKTESIRRIDPIPAGLDLRMENNLLDSFSAGAMKAWSGFAFVVGVLGTIGVNYGPMVLSGMFKVVLYTFARTFQLLSTIVSVCGQRIERYNNSYTKQKNRVNANAEALKGLLYEKAELPKELPEFRFDSSLFGGSGLKDLSAVLKAQADFTTKAFGSLLQGARREFGQLHEISSNRYIGKHFDAMMYLNDEKNFSSFAPVSGLGTPAPEGTTYRTLGKMPAGGFVCIANLPDASDNWNQIEKNYNAAGFSLIGTGMYLELKPMSPLELAKVTVAIDYLIESNKKHQLFYEELAKARTGVLTSVRSLFIQLVRSQTRISFKDSVALPLFLKTSIATKVYLVAAMDIQDHNAKVIANALAYVEQVSKLYRKPVVKELVPSVWD